MFAQQIAFSKVLLALERFVKGNFFSIFILIFVYAVTSEKETKGKKTVM